MKTIQIQEAQNGFIATDDSSQDMGMIKRDPYVFETFESLTQWLQQQFQKPPVLVAPKTKI